jgi:hypothetical protein
MHNLSEDPVKNIGWAFSARSPYAETSFHGSAAEWEQFLAKLKTLKITPTVTEVNKRKDLAIYDRGQAEELKRHLGVRKIDPSESSPGSPWVAR